MFEIGILKSRSFDVPVIAVGNITVGGTGKTPHVEYLAELLRKSCRVAILSRGYKRKSKGFILANANTPLSSIGDEPFQMKNKFPDVMVAVDKDRCHGIDQLMEIKQQPDVILLDDAFQHRYVKPGINILLVDYHRLIIYDRLLPVGRLREPMNGKDRADIVIVTKCPEDLKPMEYRVITKAMALYPYQQLYFTTLEYKTLKPMFPEAKGDIPQCDNLQDTHVLLLTGIASPKQLEHDLAPLVSHITPMSFRDHHEFSQMDIQHINQTFASLQEPKCIITTEKDAARLQDIQGLSKEVRQHMYILPLRIRFMQDQEETFNNHIIDYVRKNSRNSILVKDKNVHKAKNSNHTGNRPRTISFRNN